MMKAAPQGRSGLSPRTGDCGIDTDIGISASTKDDMKEIREQTPALWIAFRNLYG
ncbi:MAG: hypothetical protein IPI32_04020 [Austwickia sp.]|nr:hypothetical protein [Austwickia sp.]